MSGESSGEMVCRLSCLLTAFSPTCILLSRCVIPAAAASASHSASVAVIETEYQICHNLIEILVYCRRDDVCQDVSE